MTDNALRPMLAAAVTVAELERLAPKFPFRMQPKLDGIRVLIINGAAYSRSGKLIPNYHFQQWVFAHKSELDGLDGEVLCEEPTSPTCYKATSSQIMSFGGNPNFKFWIFDNWKFGASIYRHRRSWLTDHWMIRARPESLNDRVQLTPETEVATPKEVEERFEELLQQGHEGAILRHPEGGYKNGRSTLRQGYLLKLKDFHDMEGIVTGYGELMRNGNDARTSELGFTVRSSHQANMVPAGCLGWLKVKVEGSPWDEFCIGTGFDQATRDVLWRGRDLLLGRIVKFKYMPSGTHDRPRHPVFLGFRDARDL
jgi:DNA ligase-1